MYNPPFVFTDEQFYNALHEGKSVNEMAKMFGVNRSSIYKRIRKHKIKVPFIKEPIFNEHIFDSIDNEEKAYWLGFLYADGCVLIGKKRYVLELSLKADDVNHLWKFNDFLGYDRKLNKVKIGDIKCNGKLCSRCRIGVSSKHLCFRLKELGCVPRKSLILRFPNLNIFKESRFVYDFIRGYIDGDGSIRVTGKRFSSIHLSALGTKEFIEGLIATTNSMNYHIYHKHNASNTYDIYWNTTESRRLCDLMYGNSTISLDRKYEKYVFAVAHSNMCDNYRAKTVKAETC